MAHDPLIGTQLGHFKVEKQIAEGGMGVIYQATHSVIGRRAAIKVLSEKYSSDKNMIKRLQREARAVNRIGHPNIVDIFDFGQTPDNREYIVMEYLPGQSLAQVQEQLGRIPWTLAGPVLAQTLDALAAAHDLNIIHRDVKPENILIIPQDGGGVTVKILDFGIAKSISGLGPEGERLTRAGSVMGTPEYIAPEQIRGREVDGRADLYAVGAILFEMVMGRRPFESDKVINLLMMHLREPVPSMDNIPPELGVPRFVPAVVNKAMAKDPAQRFPDARTFARALGLETTAVAPSDGTRPLPELFWQKGEGEVEDAVGFSTPTADDLPEAAPARGQTRVPSRTAPGRPPLATQPSPSLGSSAPSLVGMTSPGAPPMSTELLAGGERRTGMSWRWLVPLALMLLSTSAIIFYFALRPSGGTGKGTGSALVGAGSGTATKPAIDREVDLPALAQTVGLLLRSGLTNGDGEVRQLSLQGLGALRDAAALGLIKGALKDDPHPGVRSAAALSIAALGDAAGIAALREVRESADETMKVWIDDALMRMAQTDGTVGLKEALKSESKAVRFQAALALGEASNAAARPVLEEMLSEVAANPDKKAALPLLGALARLGHEDAIKSLQRAMVEKDAVMKLGAAEGLLRMGEESVVPELKKLHSSDTSVLRLVAAKLLASTGDFSGLAALRQSITAKDPQERRIAAEGLGRISHKSAISPLAAALEDPVWKVKAAAAESLARILSQMPTAMIQRGQDWLMSALANRDWSVRYAAVGATAEMDPELAMNLLGWALKDKDARVRIAAIERAGALRTKQAIPVLASVLGNDASEEVRARAALELGRIADPAAKQALENAVNDKSHTVRALAAGGLLAQGDTKFLKDLRDAAKSPKAALRRSAITALGTWADPQAEPLLVAALQDPDGAVRFAAAHALAMRNNKAGVPELKKAVGKGGEHERQALAALASLGVAPGAELKALAGSASADSRRTAMENAAAMPPVEGLVLLEKGASDGDAGVRAAAAGSLAKLSAKNEKAAGLLRMLAKDPDPSVRTRAELALARIEKEKGALNMGEVKPVKEAVLPPPPVAPPKVPGKKSEPRPLFVDDKSPQQLYMYHSARATVAAAKGEYEAALNHLRSAQKQKDEPPLLYEFGMVHLKLALQPARSPESARAHLTSAKNYFQSYLRRAPGGRLAAKAQGGLRDVQRIWKKKEL